MTDLYQFESAWSPIGWERPLWVEVGATGDISAVHREEPTHAKSVRIAGHVLPGIPNVHSHAFQRALAGRAERAGAGESFWSWRETLYRFVADLTPDDLEAIAAQAFVEMLEAGYTAVGEFHYLHNDAAGKRYGDRCEMSDRIVRAARATGIGLTLLPVLYTASGFGEAPALAEQRRFVLECDAFVDLVTELIARHKSDPQLCIGMAPHSLRAVKPDDLRACVDALSKLDGDAPIHIHAAEQPREVEECLAWSGTRPVEWLLRNAAVDGRWCVVHATHVSDAETLELAQSGAVAGLCPTTEANLGDGLFPLRRFLDAGGVFGVGSDSNVCSSPTEELRWLEYGQRLRELRRNVAADPEEPSTGARLYRTALVGGSRSLARPIGGIAPGLRADFVVLDASHPALAARDPSLLLDGWIFSGGSSPVRDVMVGGRWVVREGKHPERDAVRRSYVEVLRRLWRA